MQPTTPEVEAGSAAADPTAVFTQSEPVLKPLQSVVRIDKGQIQSHVNEVVRSTVEETLNALLDAEADRLCGAKRYERSEPARTSGRAAMSASCTRRPAK